MQIFKTKVRNVGTSLGVLIPKNVAREMEIKRDEIIQVSIIKENPKTISNFFGAAKGAKAFERDHTERRF